MDYIQARKRKTRQQGGFRVASFCWEKIRWPIQARFWLEWARTINYMPFWLSLPVSSV